jgi:hypothetical protein
LIRGRTGIACCVRQRRKLPIIHAFYNADKVPLSRITLPRLAPIFCSGGHPACRRAGASRPAEKTLAHTQRAGIFQNHTPLPSCFSGVGTRPPRQASRPPPQRFATSPLALSVCRR